jgi:hypothetical protein
VLELLAGRHAAPLRVLIDETDLRAGLVSFADIRRIVTARQRALALRTARIAVLAPSTVIYGLNRVVHRLGGADAEDRIGVFKVRADAVAWLADPPG